MLVYRQDRKGRHCMTLGEKIYMLRTEKGLSQESFGDSLGVSRQSVSKWETGVSVPELDKIVAISNLFGVTTDYLLREDLEREMRAGEEKESEPALSDGRHAVYYSSRRLHYEYKSKKMIGNLPLVHIHTGAGLYRAKGVIAIGNIAEGALAIGFVAVGGFAIGLVSVGLLCLATLAVGIVALGSFSFGIITFGAVSVGIFSMGALTFGQFAFGASAHGAQVAVGDVAQGNIALGYSQAIGNYTEVSGRQPFDYENACRLIDEHVSPSWSFFKTWAKHMVKFF